MPSFDPEFCKRMGCKSCLRSDHIGRMRPSRWRCLKACMGLPDCSGSCGKCMKMNWKPEHCKFSLERLMLDENVKR